MPGEEGGGMPDTSGETASVGFDPDAIRFLLDA